MDIRRVLAIVTGLLTAGQIQAQVSYLTDYREVSVLLQAPTPPALSDSSSGSRYGNSAFGNENMNIWGLIEWQEINGWQATPVSAEATMNAAFSATVISLNTHLTAAAGGDPYGIQFQPGVSGTAEASSVFEMTFSLSAPVAYSYSYDFGFTPTLEKADLTLSSGNYGEVQLSRTSGASGSGLLQADTYTLRFVCSILAENDKIGDTVSSLIFTFEPTPTSVPEPSPSLLVGMGLLALFGLRWQSFKREGLRAAALQRLKPARHIVVRKTR